MKTPNPALFAAPEPQPQASAQVLQASFASSTGVPAAVLPPQHQPTAHHLKPAFDESQELHSLSRSREFTASGQGLGLTVSQSQGVDGSASMSLINSQPVPNAMMSGSLSFSTPHQPAILVQPSPNQSQSHLVPWTPLVPQHPVSQVQPGVQNAAAATTTMLSPPPPPAGPTTLIPQVAMVSNTPPMTPVTPQAMHMPSAPVAQTQVQVGGTPFQVLAPHPQQSTAMATTVLTPTSKPAPVAGAIQPPPVLVASLSTSQAPSVHASNSGTPMGSPRTGVPKTPGSQSLSNDRDDSTPTNTGNKTPTSAPSTAAPTISKKVEFDGTNVFISGLHSEVQDKHLLSLFQGFGELVSCRVLVQSETGRSKGVGFAHYVAKDSAAQAIEEMNNKTVEVNLSGEDSITPSMVTFKIRAKIAEDAATFAPEVSNKLFIRNLPTGTTEGDLDAVYKKFGRIVQTTLLPDRSSQGKREGSKLLMGYVTFTEIDDASKAIRATNRAVDLFEGQQKPLEVKAAESLQVRNQRRRRMEEESTPTKTATPIANQQIVPGAAPQFMMQGAPQLPMQQAPMMNQMQPAMQMQPQQPMHGVLPMNQQPQAAAQFSGTFPQHMTPAQPQMVPIAPGNPIVPNGMGNPQILMPQMGQF